MVWGVHGGLSKVIQLCLPFRSIPRPEHGPEPWPVWHPPFVHDREAETLVDRDISVRGGLEAGVDPHLVCLGNPGANRKTTPALALLIRLDGGIAKIEKTFAPRDVAGDVPSHGVGAQDVRPEDRQQAPDGAILRSAV